MFAEYHKKNLLHTKSEILAMRVGKQPYYMPSSFLRKLSANFRYPAIQYSRLYYMLEHELMQHAGPYLFIFLHDIV